jgi:hypothetical protein
VRPDSASSPEEHGDDTNGLNVALNEATLLGLEVDRSRRLAGATFAVLSLPESGEVPSDRRVQMLFVNVGRVAARLTGPDRRGAVPISVEQLLEVVQSFGGSPIHGWKFFDVEHNPLEPSGAGESLDIELEGGSRAHSISLFQENGRRLDVCVWFEGIALRTPDGEDIDPDEFMAAGRRWWDAFHRHDPRTQGHGLFSTAPKPKSDA